MFLSRFMGLIRDKVVSYFYGAGPETDIYFASFAIPDFINYLLAGGYFSITLIPLLSRYFKESEDEGWKFFSSALYCVTAAVCLLTLIAWIFAPQLAHVAAPGFGPAELERLTTFLRISLPAQACFLPGACFTALLYMRRQFTIPALTPLIYNACIILMGMLFLTLDPTSGMEGFLWGVLTGAALGSFILPVLAVKAGGLSLKPVWKHPGLKRFIVLALPLMLGQSIVVLDEQFLRIFGSLGPEGSVSILTYARRIMMVPVGVVAQAAGVASYPFLAELVAKGDRAQFNATVSKSITTALSVIIPLSFWMLSSAEATIRLIFEQGRFNAVTTQNTAIILAIMLVSTSLFALQQFLVRGFYAQENTITPVIVGTIATAVSLPIYFMLAKYYAAAGIAFAGVMALLIYNLGLIWCWKIRYDSEALEGIVERSATLLLCSTPCTILGYLAAQGTASLLPAYPLSGAALSLLVSLAAFGIPYLLICYHFTPRLWADTMGVIARVLRKRK